MQDARDLTGTVVLVTGATSGIGRAATSALLAEGANVVVTGRREERLAELAKEHGEERLLVHAADIRKPATSRELVDLAVGRWGRLDSAILNAGLGRDGSILDGNDAEMEELLVTNLHSVVWGIRSVVPHMMQQGAGDIIVMASVAGLRGAKHEAVYAASKAGAIELAATTDRELRSSGIRVSSICPAAVATEFAMGHGRTPDMPQLDDWMQPDDIADTIVFMLRQPRRMRTTQIALWSSAEGS